jgi:RNA polymerase sigma factor (sigma-70 family)
MLNVAEKESLPVAQAKAGDAGAWDALLRRYRLPLYVYLFQMVGHEQTSFDLVQETMVNAVRNIGTLQHEDKFGSWLFGIAHQKCIQLWRKQNREESALREMVDSLMETNNMNTLQPEPKSNSRLRRLPTWKIIRGLLIAFAGLLTLMAIMF